MQWEYKQDVVPADPAKAQESCERNGKDGWELAGMLMLVLNSRIIGTQPQPAILMQFKRPIPAEVENFLPPVEYSA